MRIVAAAPASQSQRHHDRLGEEIQGERLAGQMSGREFEEIVCSFIDETFKQLSHLRPGLWTVEQITARNQASSPVLSSMRISRLLRVQLPKILS